MADRISQLQDKVKQQYENFCNTVGVLVQTAPASKLPISKNSAEKSPSGNPEDYPQGDYRVLFSKAIINTARDINTLIESLPMINSKVSREELQKLESENQEAAKRVEAELKRAEEMLPEIQGALADIAEIQIQCQEIESLMLNVTY